MGTSWEDSRIPEILSVWGSQGPDILGRSQDIGDTLVLGYLVFGDRGTSLSGTSLDNPKIPGILGTSWNTRELTDGSRLKY